MIVMTTENGCTVFSNDLMPAVRDLVILHCATALFDHVKAGESTIAEFFEDFDQERNWIPLEDSDGELWEFRRPGEPHPCVSVHRNVAVNI